jgi:hypothetical protein
MELRASNLAEYKAGREMDEVNDSARLVEERVAKLVEDNVTEIQAAAKNCIQEEKHIN